MSRTVPVIDLSPYLQGNDKMKVARQVSDACETIGFLVIGNHGVPHDVIEAMITKTEEFYALPIKDKISIQPTVAGAFRGYTATETRSLAKSRGVETPPDLREGFTINRVQDKSDPYFHTPDAVKLFADNVWPSEDLVPGFKKAYTDYYLAMDSLTKSLMRVFALALGLPEAFFDSKVDKHFSNLCTFHYPPATSAPKLGQLRGGAHTDFGSMTLVYGVPTISGLQGATGDDWEDVPSIPGTFAVNIGDLMAQWTNDKWVSTMHRVANPSDGEWDKSRYSIVFFHQPNYDTLIESLDTTGKPKYPPVTSKEYLVRKLSAMNV